MTGFSSSQYWEGRYSSGGNSGMGSYGRLADFKAEFINTFIELNGVTRAIEFGCGDGNQLSLLSVPEYVGVDVSDATLEKCRAKFRHTNYQFVNYDGLPDVVMADLVLSIDVIFHLVEDPVFEKYIRDLFCFSKSYVMIYSSDYDAEWPTLHVRHRNVSGYISKMFPEWALLARVPNIYPFDLARQNDTSFCDFMVFGRERRRCHFVVPGAPSSETLQ